MMPIVRRVLFLLYFAGALAACDEQAVIDKLAPKDQVATAERIFSELGQKNYIAIEKRLDSSIQSSSVRGTLTQMAALVPAEQPKSIRIVGVNTIVANGVKTYNLALEYEYSTGWLLTNIVLREDGGQTTVLGLHVKPMERSLEALNRFTLEGKGPFQYIILALAVIIPIFILYALVLCIRTPIAGRKWLWLLFIAVGLGKLSLNWTDGSFGIQPISLNLLGAGFSYAGPAAPIIFSVAIPVGAIMFLLKRRSLVLRGISQGAGA